MLCSLYGFFFILKLCGKFFGFAFLKFSGFVVSIFFSTVDVVRERKLTRLNVPDTRDADLLDQMYRMLCSGTDVESEDLLIEIQCLLRRRLLERSNFVSSSDRHLPVGEDSV